MKLPDPVLVAHLFPGMHRELVSLLKGLSDQDWEKPTICANWSVRQVALHILGGELGNLSRRRDHHVLNANIQSWDELVTFINAWNESWVQASNRLSPRVLIDMLELFGPQMCAYFQELDPFQMGGEVSWAGPGPAPVWLDIAREYTERWHHQQHIRDAVGVPGLKQPEYFAPVLAAFACALPYTFRDFPASEKDVLTLTMTGAAGGSWSIVMQDNAWILVEGAPAHPRAEVIMPDDLAWRLFTRGVSRGQIQDQINIRGDKGLAGKVFEMVSIIA